ncbi:MAG: diaminopimelate epimerase [Deltaproteobacteria bacterium]|nr:diaminopimelate epimerase [Deltaproteobacteria bacterium]
MTEFWKMNGSGNDFILIDNRDGKFSEEGMKHLAIRACRRRESVGADGMIFITNSDIHDFAWRFFNADGSEAEMCGNGGRCVARFARLNGIAPQTMTFDTLAGPVSASVADRIVKILMPAPSGLKKDLDLPHEKGWISVDFINTGVPHVVVQVERLKDHPVFDQGRVIRNHSMFSPGGTNANFMSIDGPSSIRIRTYERGVEDETLACGTGAMASALIANIRGGLPSPVSVTTSGGEELKIYFEKSAETYGRVWLEGNTSIVYKGSLHEEAL